MSGNVQDAWARNQLKLLWQRLASNNGLYPIESVNTVAASGSAQTLPDVTTATMHDVTLTASTVTFTFPAAAAGKSFRLLARQDGTGSRVANWPTNVEWSGGTAPTLSTGANKKDWLDFRCWDGTKWEGKFVLDLEVPAAGPIFVDSCQGWTNSGTSITTTNLTAGAINSGDLLIAAFNISQFGASRDLTIPSGWSAIDSGGLANSDCRMRVIKRLSDGTDVGNSFTFSLTGSAQTHSCAVIRCRNANSTIGAFAIANSSSTSTTAPSNNDLPLAFFIQNDGATDGNTGNSISTSGWTTDEDEGSSFYHAIIAGHHGLVASGTTIAPSPAWSGTVANPMSAIVVLTP